jgi:uncharacterized membrane protein
MQPNNEQNGQSPKSWGDFQARKLAKALEGHPDAISEALTQSIALVEKKKPGRKPKPPVEAKEATLAEVLKQAVEIAMTRRGRILQEDAIREQTLLEVLASAMKRMS